MSKNSSDSNMLIHSFSKTESQRTKPSELDMMTAILFPYLSLLAPHTPQTFASLKVQYLPLYFLAIHLHRAHTLSGHVLKVILLALL